MDLKPGEEALILAVRRAAATTLKPYQRLEMLPDTPDNGTANTAIRITNGVVVDHKRTAIFTIRFEHGNVVLIEGSSNVWSDNEDLFGNGKIWNAPPRSEPDSEEF